MCTLTGVCQTASDRLYCREKKETMQGGMFGAIIAVTNNGVYNGPIAQSNWLVDSKK